MPKAIIMMGASGSGKSTWVRENYPDSILCSADEWFADHKGNYEFNPKELGNAHAACLRKFIKHMIYGTLDVVCDNTNTTVAEIAPYIATAQAYGYKPIVVYMDTPSYLCKSRNDKGVPRHTIDRMCEQSAAVVGSWPVYWPELQTVKAEYE